MKANELRIKNLVYRKGYVYKITSIGIDTFSSRRTTGYEFAIINEPFIGNELDEKPIPLTEEWLEKFGFEFEPNPILGYSFGSMILIQYNEGWGDLADIKSFKPIHYVHQLQNLYFALTGEELAIKDVK